MYDNTVAIEIAGKYNGAPLTDFSRVNNRTSLKSLNLNWTEQDLPERIRTKHVHRLHPYMGKFIPQLVEIFLRKYCPNIVYDPFCGSGTTLVEANTLGINSIGTDISAFNVLLSRVKTVKYDIALLEKDIHDILSKMEQFREEFLSDKYNKVYKTNSQYLNTWFADQSRKELLFYLSLIPNYHYQDLLKIILSRAARSARLVTHFDLDFPKLPQKEPYYCYKHRRTCQPVQEANKFLKRYAFDTLHRIKAFSQVRTDAEVKVIHNDSRKVKLPKGIDMIFTSPPYLGLIDYHDQHRYAYELLDLKNEETREIGAAKNGQSDQAKTEYIKGINKVLLHTRDYMVEKALAIIVVNDKFGLYNANDVGFKEIGCIKRHVNRRTGRRNSIFYENILIWQKR